MKVYYETVAPVPSITVDPATVDATAAETVGTLAITYANLTISDMDDFDIQYYNAEGEELSEGPDWILVEVAEDNGDYVVSYVIEKNVGAARTAYFKVYALDDETNLVYSNLVTVTQAAPAVDYATLPFDFDGGRADIESTNGLTQTGLGTDYSANDTKLKFDGSGDYVILKLQGGTAASLSFKTKGNTFSGGTFTVQTSTDGETYTNLAVFNENNIDGNYTCFISSSIKYIKWIYTEKVNGNVGLGSISVVALSFSVTLNGSGYATYCSPDGLDFTGVTEYSAWQITGANSSTGEITFSQVTGSVKGGTGLLLKGDAGETITLTSSNSENELSGNKLYGTLAPTYIEADQYYGLSGNKFVKVGAGTVPAGKALLPASVVGSSIKAFNFVFEDDPDGINSIDNGELTIDNAAIYNLAGQRLSKMQKGINIVNGKKILY